MADVPPAVPSPAGHHRVNATGSRTRRRGPTTSRSEASASSGTMGARPRAGFGMRWCIRGRRLEQHVSQQRVSMVKTGRLLVIAAALSLGLQAGVATAQTVIARKLPAGSTVELVVNGVKVGSGTPDAQGDARVPFDVQAQTGKTEMDATVHVDECSDTLRRVLVADRNQAPPVPEPGCSRKDVIGVFWIKKVTTLVVDTGSPNATVFLRQGPV